MNNLLTSILVISIFKNIIEDDTVNAFLDFLTDLNQNKPFDITIKSYSNFIFKLYENEQNQNFYSYIKKLIYTDSNIISRGCGNCIKENNQLSSTAEYELSVFNKLLAFDYSKIKTIMTEKFKDQAEIISHMPAFFTDGFTPLNLDNLLDAYKKDGYGIFACYNAFKYTRDKEIKPVKYFDTLTFSDLKNYDYQKEVIKKNTLAFLNEKEANNILLYGDRGCGKSSTVKALLNEFGSYNLKIVQIYKESIAYLADLYELLRNQPAKFIIFADDISFEEDDENFSSVKAALEGSLSNKPKNVVIYATTNRIHLVKESFSSRTGNEVHCNDTIDETVSLSDRFGIILTFSLLTKPEYLDIVAKIAKDCCVTVNDSLYKKAEEFAALKSIRTPRTARQFITDYIANNEE